MAASTVGRIYKNVIDDVITGVKEAFLDEGVEEQVLLELKQLWEKKLNESKALELTEAVAPIVKMGTNKPEATIVQSGITIQRNNPASSDPNFTYPQVRVIPNNQVIHYPGNAAGTIGSGNITIRVPTAQPNTIALPPELTAQLLQQNNGSLTQVQIQALTAMAQQQQFVRANPPQAQYTVSLPVPGGMPGQMQNQQITVNQQVQPIAATPQQLQQLQQQVAAAQQTPQALRIVKLPGQTDGGTMDSSDSDDSSDDNRLNDDDDDNDDPDEDDDDQNEQELDEEPLNSADDVSDEEVSEVQEIDNVVVCQYDKVSRSRNRWKFVFKDGIMNIQGRDYLFQKSVGDAEW